MGPLLAFTPELLIQHRDFVRAIAVSVLHDEHAAEDVSQDALLATLRHPPSDDHSPRGWFATLARNFARNRVRTEARRIAREKATAISEIVRQANSQERVETAQTVVAAVLSLDEPYKSVLLLRYYDGLLPAEIATQRGENASTIRSQLTRAHARLRARLEGEFGSPRALVIALGRFAGSAAPASKALVAAVAACAIVGTFGFAFWVNSDRRVVESTSATAGREVAAPGPSKSTAPPLPPTLVTDPPKTPPPSTLVSVAPKRPAESVLSETGDQVAAPTAPQESPKTAPAQDPASATPLGMCYVPPGTAKIGLDVKTIEALTTENANFLTYLAACTPAHEVAIEGFYLDQMEVTNEQWGAYLDAVGQQPSDQLVGGYWLDGKIPKGHEHKPVVYVSQSECMAYAAYYKKRLPTEIEWEYAARGSDGRLYPWGAEFDFGGKLGGERANCGSSKGSRVPADVGSFPDGASPFGVLDLCGNVWEWTSSPFTAYDTKHTSIDVHTKNGKKTYSAASILSAKQIVIRGGEFSSKSIALLSSVRQGTEPGTWFNTIGFRCAKDVQ